MITAASSSSTAEPPSSDLPAAEAITTSFHSNPGSQSSANADQCPGDSVKQAQLNSTVHIGKSSIQEEEEGLLSNHMAPHEVGARSSATRTLLVAILKLATPISVSQLAQFSIMLVMMIALGHLGVHELGGASIAFGIINATGFAFGSGLCGALETLLSQSFGHDPTSKMYGVYAQRMVVILALFAVPLTISLFYVESFLIKLGEPVMVARYAGQFCQICAAGLPFIMLLELLRRYYASQRLPNPVFVAVVAAALLNPFVLYFAITSFGYDGAAWTWVTLMVGMDVALLAYIIASGIFRRTWGGWSWSALEQLLPMLKMALPSLMMACSEWTAMEVNSVVAGVGTPTELAAYAISSQVAALCWSIASGIFLASTVVVGNSIGSGHPLLAKRQATLSTYLVLGVALCNVIVVYPFRKVIGRFFTEDDDVVELFSRLTPFFLAFHVADALQCNCLGILRGCGLQNIGMLIVLVGLTGLGMPLGIFLFIRFSSGIEALWIGPIVGCVTVTLPAYLYVFLCHVRWGQLRADLGAEKAEDAMVVVEEMSIREPLSVKNARDGKENKEIA